MWTEGVSLITDQSSGSLSTAGLSWLIVMAILILWLQSMSFSMLQMRKCDRFIHLPKVGYLTHYAWLGYAEGGNFLFSKGYRCDLKYKSAG